MNPQNVCIFTGNVSSVKIIKYRDGKINYVEFRLKVPRNYLNKGTQLHDFPVFRLSKIYKDFDKFMEMIKEGNNISISGQYVTEKVVFEGKDCYKTYILAEDIVLNSRNPDDYECELPY